MLENSQALGRYGLRSFVEDLFGGGVGSTAHNMMIMLGRVVYVCDESRTGCAVASSSYGCDLRENNQTIYELQKERLCCPFLLVRDINERECM